MRQDRHESGYSGYSCEQHENNYPKAEMKFHASLTLCHADNNICDTDPQLSLTADDFTLR